MGLLDVILTVGADSSQVATGMRQARTYVKDVEGEIKGSITSMFAVGSVIEFGKQLFELAGQIQDVSDRFGVSTTFVQQWTNAGAESGITMEDIGQSLNKLAIAQSKANGGNVEMINHFAALGVSVEDLKSLGPEQIWEKISHSSMNAEDMVALFGKSALKLVPVLKAVADGTVPLGKAMDENVIKRLDAAGDSMTRAANNAKIQGGNLLSFLIELGEKIKKITPFAIIEDKLLGDNVATEVKKVGTAVDGVTESMKRAAAAGDDVTSEIKAQGEATKDLTSLREKLDKLGEEATLRNLDNESKLRQLQTEKQEIEKDYWEKRLSGLYDEAAYLQKEIALAEKQKEIDAVTKQIHDDTLKTQEEQTKEREKAAEQAEKDREEAEEEARTRQNALDTAVEENAELEQTLAGHKDIAARMKEEFEIEQKIKQAYEDGNLELAHTLEYQEQLLAALRDQKALEDAIKAGRVADPSGLTYSTPVWDPATQSWKYTTVNRNTDGGGTSNGYGSGGGTNITALAAIELALAAGTMTPAQAKALIDQLKAQDAAGGAHAATAPPSTRAGGGDTNLGGFGGGGGGGGSGSGGFSNVAPGGGGLPGFTVVPGGGDDPLTQRNRWLINALGLTANTDPQILQSYLGANYRSYFDTPSGLQFAGSAGSAGSVDTAVAAGIPSFVAAQGESNNLLQQAVDVLHRIDTKVTPLPGLHV